MADKGLQRAVGRGLEAVYEPAFRECAYGLRPGRAAQQAVPAVWQGRRQRGGGRAYKGRFFL